MFTVAELEIVGENQARIAINKSIEDLIMAEGRIRLDYLTRQQLDLVIHMIRHARAMAPETNPQESRDLEVF